MNFWTGLLAGIVCVGVLALVAYRIVLEHVTGWKLGDL